MYFVIECTVLEEVIPYGGLQCLRRFVVSWIRLGGCSVEGDSSIQKVSPQVIGGYIDVWSEFKEQLILWVESVTLGVHLGSE